MPQEITTLISTLRYSFSTHHPRIIRIYALINDLTTLSTKLERINKQNEDLGEGLLRCESEVEVEVDVDVDVVRGKMIQLVKEKEEVEWEMKRVRELWNEAMRWVEEKGILYGVK